MKKLPLYIQVLLTLGATALVLPVSGGYFCSGWIFIWLVLSGAFKEARADSPELSRLKFVAAPVHAGVVAFVGATLLTALLSYFFSPYAGTLKETVRVAVHMSIKLGLLWFVLHGVMVVALKRGFDLARMTRWLALWMAINFVYCVAQRYLGIDWTHGFAARLGPHRFAYGVYRLSGFMGHPLSLGYNLVLVISSAAAVLLLPEMCQPRERRAWLVVLAFAGLTLLLSGSRFPVAIVPIVVVICEGQRLLRHWRWATLGLVALAAALWIEGSTLARVSEMFFQGAPLVERFPRLLNWQIHLKMGADFPLFGVGQAGLDAAYATYYSGVNIGDQARTAHNIFLQTWGDGGVVGLAGLVALLAGIVVTIRRLGPQVSVGVKSLFVVAALAGLMQNTLRDSEFIYAFWYLLALWTVRASLVARRD